MRKITPEMVRNKCDKLDIPHRQVWEACGLKLAWFNKMIMDNPKYAFVNPNVELMNKIWSYLTLYEKHHKGIERAIMKEWRSLN